MRNERGFTLIEVMIAVFIMSMVMLTALSALQMAGRNVAAQTLDNMAYSAVETVVAEVAEDLHYADAAGVTIIDVGNAQVITFRLPKIPVDLDGDGTFLDADGNIEFGYNPRMLPVNGRVMYEFVKTSDISEGTRVDLNWDTDTDDAFDVGYMQKKITNPDDASDEIILKRGNWIVQPKDNWGGDIDGDGDKDPIFVKDGTRVTISVWSLGADPRVAPRLANSRATVFPVGK